MNDIDHRVSGNKLDLFHQQEESPGMVFWHPRGWELYRVLEDYEAALAKAALAARLQFEVREGEGAFYGPKRQTAEMSCSAEPVPCSAPCLPGRSSKAPNTAATAAKIAPVRKAM